MSETALVKLKDNKIYIDVPAIPDLDKLSSVQPEIDAIMAFTDWLANEWKEPSECGHGPILDAYRDACGDDGHGVLLASFLDWWRDDRSIAIRRAGVVQLAVHGFLGLDPNKMERQRRLILLQCRLINALDTLRKKFKHMKDPDRELLVYSKLVDTEKEERKHLWGA